MEGILELFECVAESPRHGEYLTDFLKTCTEHQAFSSKNANAVQPFIAFANVKLGSSKERLEGLILLKAFLPQCSDEKFTEWAISWMLQCIKGTDKTNSLETNCVAYDVLGTLLDMSSKFQEMTKNVNNTVVARFMEQLAAVENTTSRLNASVLSCVSVLIRHYGATCTSHRYVAEGFILGLVDSRDVCLVELAARSFSLLPLVGGGGALGSNHKTRWLSQQRQTCGSLRKLQDTLLENVNVIETYKGDGSMEELALTELTDMDPVVRVRQVANRLVNLSKYLAAMLLGGFPVAKSVLPNLIVGIIFRGLSVNCGTLGKTLTSDLLTLGSVLPSVHVALLGTLRALIACLGVNMYPLGKLICRLLLQTLTWTTCERQEYGLTRPYALLRIEACRTLQAWLRTARAGSCVEGIADELFAVLKKDIYTEKTVVQLTVQGGKKTKKLRKQLAAEESLAAAATSASKNGSGRVKLVNLLANQGPCLAALDTLYWLIHCAGVSLKPTLHKAIQETMLTVLYDVQRSSVSDVPVPYSDVSCRLAAYKLLTSLTLEPHPSWPPPLQFSLHLLAKGQVDSDASIAGVCLASMSAVLKLSRPSCQSLMFPVGLEEMRSSVGLEASPSVPRAPPPTPVLLKVAVEDLTRSRIGKRGVSFMGMEEDGEVAVEDLTRSRIGKRGVSFIGMEEDGEVATTPKKYRKEETISLYLTSDEEDLEVGPGESNVSMASSNSNYQDLVLNKSNISQADYFVDCLDRTPDQVVDLTGPVPDLTSLVLERTKDDSSASDRGDRPVREVDLTILVPENKSEKSVGPVQEVDLTSSVSEKLFEKQSEKEVGPVQEVDLTSTLEQVVATSAIPDLGSDLGSETAVEQVDLEPDELLGPGAEVQEVDLDPVTRAKSKARALELDRKAQLAVQEVDLEEIEQVDLAEDDDSCEIVAKEGQTNGHADKRTDSFQGLVDDQIVQLCISDFISNLPKN